MRLLMISDHADPLAPIGSKEAGGQNIYVLNLSKFLAKQNIAVDVYTRWDSSSKREIVHVLPNLRVIRVKAGPKAYMPRDSLLNVIEEFTENIKSRIETENIQYDAILSNYWFSGIIGLKLAKQLHLPQAHVYHSIGQNRFNALKRLTPQREDYVFYQTRLSWEKKIAQHVTGIIATSYVEQQDICTFFGVCDDKVVIIPVGVNVREFRPIKQAVARRQLGLPQSQPLILYVGRIEWRKGIETLLRAVKQLPAKWNRAHIYIVGGGKKTQEKLDEAERRRLIDITETLGIAKRVSFLGGRPQPQVKKYYAAADVCVIPSYYEPFGIVPLESMACGTPVVASRTGGLQASIEDRETGRLAQPADAADFSSKIDEVLSNGRDFYSNKARQHIVANFSWSAVAADVGQYLRTLSRDKES